ncbi:MAG TPA: hypothetical protein VMS60_00010 [Solirubrobacterales bacterium]|nr:hypothetical protein [Solirubrobacterales bacterium]
MSQTEQQLSQTDRLLANAASYAGNFDKGHLPLPPSRAVAVLACMDARLNPLRLGTEEIVSIPRTDSVRGFVYEVESGSLREVA